MTVALSVACMVVFVILLFFLMRENFFHVGVFFILFALLDVFFPAFYWSIFGQVDNPAWMPLLTSDDIAWGLNFYTLFFMIFFGSMVASSSLGLQKRQQPISELHFSRSNIYYLGLFFLVLNVVRIGIGINSAGGVEAWLQSRLIFAAVLGDDSAEKSLTILDTLPVSDIFQALAGLAFCVRDQKKGRVKYFFFTFVFPFFAFVFSALTFLRGSVLSLVITLAFAEVIRRKDGFANADTSMKSALKPLIIALVSVFAVVYMYGSLRDSFRSQAANLDGELKVESKVPTFLTAGHGLLGVSHIVNRYGNDVSFMNGKTYIDMLLLPVPRFVYKSKPQWYGIDDITRGMGWPESTQSAVTMPGEAYANFGFWGLIIALPLGVFFGSVQRVLNRDRLLYLIVGPVFFFHMTSVTNWMAFTGFVNSISKIIFLLVIVVFLRSKLKNAKI